ncbi:MAG TPA: CARDB domain-containing protein [Vicinamibacterales bacterium]|nr:CARDB domain-containing protein [Vicinamibacterales bacterium]
MHPRFVNGIRLAAGLAVFLLASDTARVAPQSTRPGGPGDSRVPTVSAQSATFALHGPFALSGRRLARMALQPDILPILDEEEQDEVEPLDCEDCPVISARIGEPEAAPQTPPPTTTPWSGAISMGGVDPQIAAGTSYLVVTTTGRIAFYDKAGALLTDGSGNTLNPIAVQTLFTDLIADMNSSLNLPDGADPATYQLSRFYDARALYDPFRHRFIIAALAGNGVPRGVDPNTGKNVFTTMDRAARRTKIMAAVSRTEDPRDGWLLYWWNAVVDDGLCNDPSVNTCDGTYNEPGDAGDYPSLGISDRFVVVTNHVGRYDPARPNEPGSSVERYGIIHVLSADSLAGLAPPSPSWAYWDIPYPNDQVTANYVMQPAVQHTPDPLGFTFVAANAFSDGRHDTLAVFGFSPLDGAVAPPLRGASVKVQTIVYPTDGPQKDGNVVGGALLNIKGVATPPLKATYRDNRLYVTWHTCRDWTDSKTCAAAVQIVKVETSGFVNGTLGDDPSIDRVFGWRNALEDPPSTLAWYGLPAVEVNRNGDMAIVYVRSSAGLYPEARYSVYPGNWNDVLPSRVLKAGEGPLGKNQTDTAGIAVDPFDDTAIWMADSYAYNPNPGVSQAQQRLAVGKVFGRAHPDLVIKTLSYAVSSGKEGTTVTGTVRVRNQGDGDAGPSRLIVALTRKGNGSLAQIPLRSAQVAALASGGEHVVTFSRLLPRTCRGCGPAVRGLGWDLVAHADFDQVVAEYSETNNVAIRKQAVHASN